MFNPIDGRGLEFMTYIGIYIVLYWFWNGNGEDIKKIIRRWRNVA